MVGLWGYNDHYIKQRGQQAVQEAVASYKQQIEPLRTEKKFPQKLLIFSLIWKNVYTNMNGLLILLNWVGN